MAQTQIQIKDIEAIKGYQINIDYDIDKLINFINGASDYKDKIINGFDSFDDFKESIALMGIRTTLENESKISKKEALNCLMGFPLNFNLELFVKMLSDFMFHGMEMNERIKHIIVEKIKTTDMGNVVRLKLDFDKKKELISRNFESINYIDIQEFLAWAESRCFIIKKS